MTLKIGFAWLGAILMTLNQRQSKLRLLKRGIQNNNMNVSPTAPKKIIYAMLKEREVVRSSCKNASEKNVNQSTMITKKSPLKMKIFLRRTL